MKMVCCDFMVNEYNDCQHEVQLLRGLVHQDCASLVFSI